MHGMVDVASHGDKIRVRVVVIVRGCRLYDIRQQNRFECSQPVSLPSHPVAMSFGSRYPCPLERPLVANRQAWGDSSGGSGGSAAAIPQEAVAS